MLRFRILPATLISFLRTELRLHCKATEGHAATKDFFSCYRLEGKGPYKVRFWDLYGLLANGSVHKHAKKRGTVNNGARERVILNA